jgi:sugar phosphate isomerase/epimerase
VHAPITDRFGSDLAISFSNAASDNAVRQAAIRETEAALQIARQIPFQTLVVHLGVPSRRAVEGDNSRSAAIRSADEICAAAAAAGVKVAFEVIPNDLSSAAALAAMLDRDLDATSAGVCLDFGHAHMAGDAADAVETLAEHLVATHVHDNHGRDDEHLVPYRGTINWDMVLQTLQKVGYEGAYVMELAATGAPVDVLEDARRARERFETTLMQDAGFFER